MVVTDFYKGRKVIKGTIREDDLGRIAGIICKLEKPIK